jgi:hypothetical protein
MTKREGRTTKKKECVLAGTREEYSVWKMMKKMSMKMKMKRGRGWMKSRAGPVGG